MADLAAVRAWAQQNGHEVGTRGRIKEEIFIAYAIAHPGAEVATVAAKAAPVDVEKLVERPLASPGVAESYGSTAAAVASVYVPGADLPELTEEYCLKAEQERACIVRIGEKLKLYRDQVIPDGALIILDYRLTKPVGSR